MDRNEKVIAIAGITEAIKQYGVPAQFCPTIAIIIGGLIGFAEKNSSEGILEGVMLGAIVTGGYSLTKRVGSEIIKPLNKQPDYVRLEADDDRGV